jgi:hypothetical protein
MAREKAKKDIIINGVTYKGIQLFESTNRQGETTYDIDTAGVSTIIRQFIKNNYGDIKNWVRSRSFAGGSAVDVYLWNVPDEWYGSIKEFADSFGKYHEYGYDGGDGYWRGRDAGATLPDGTRVRNFSPYMDVSNTPPWDAKERNMTPPDYTKSMPKKSSSGFKSKFSKESKTAGFELVYNCGNGWKVYRKTISEGETPRYDYRVVKDYEVKPVGKEQFYAMKGDMLESGFQWSVKAQCFERSNVPFGLKDSFLESSVCGVLGKYFPKIGEAKSEAPTETPQPESTPTEMNLDQYIDDMQMLVELETDEEQRLSLLQYVNDLQTLKMLG